MRGKGKITIFLSLFIIILTGFFELGISQIKEKIVNIEYYFYNPCRSCTDGEEFKETLEESINEANIVDSKIYEILVKNIADNNINEEFKKLTKDMKISNGLEPSVPLLKVNDVFIFGTETIEREGIKIIEQEIKR